MPRLPFVLFPLVAAVVLGGCIVHARAAAPEVMVFGPPLVRVGPVVHFHGPNCGHAARWYGGRWVYFVGGRWEYDEAGRSYVYPTIDSRPAGVHVYRPQQGRGHAYGHDRRGEDDDDDENEAPRRYSPTRVQPEPMRPEPVRPVPQN